MVRVKPKVCKNGVSHPGPISWGGLCRKCGVAAWDSGHKKGGDQTTPDSARQAAFCKAAIHGTSGFQGVQLRSSSSWFRAALAPPRAIAIVKMNYFANAGLHVKDGLLTTRLCLRQLRCKVANKQIPLPLLCMCIASESPSPVAEVNGLPGHSSDDWPADSFLGVMEFQDRTMVPSAYDVDEKYATRDDSGVYKVLDKEGAPTFCNMALRKQSHPFRGAAARARIIRIWKGWATMRKARAASGLSWDKWIEQNHRRKDNEGCVLFSRNFILCAAGRGLGSPPAPVRNRIRKLNKLKKGRFAFPLVYHNKNTKVFKQLLRIARGLKSRQHVKGALSPV